MVQLTSLVLATAAFAGAASAAPAPVNDNPWVNTDRYVPQSYGKLLQTTVDSFTAKNDTLNAARARTVQKSVSTFTWIVTRAGLANIETAHDGRPGSLQPPRP
jgi:cellulose 1,4-beta-cellobiosidase